MTTLSSHTDPSGTVVAGAVVTGAAAEGAVISGQPGEGPRRPGASRFSRIWRILWRSMAFLLLLLLFFLAGILLALRNENVQAWLQDEANAVLAASAETSGLHVRLTRLSGSLPFSMQVGVELADAHGLWLEAPLNTFEWDWTALPGTIHISGLVSHNPRLLRLPDLPAAAPSEPSPPMTEHSLRTALGEAVQTLSTLPGWLPAVLLDRLAVVDAALPQSLLGAALPASGEGNQEQEAGENADASVQHQAAGAPGAISASGGRAQTPAAPQNEPAGRSGQGGQAGTGQGDAGQTGSGQASGPTNTGQAENAQGAVPAQTPAAAVPLSDDAFFRADLDAGLKAGSKGGSLRIVLAASGQNHAPLLVADTPCGGLEVLVEADFAPREDTSGKTAVQTLLVTSSLEATVQPVASAAMPDEDRHKAAETPQAAAAPGQHATASQADSPNSTASAKPDNSANTAKSAKPQSPSGSQDTPRPSEPLATLLAHGARLSLALEAQALAVPGAPGNMAATARAGLTRFDLKAGPLSGTGHITWHSPDTSAAAPAAGTAVAPPSAAARMNAQDTSWLYGPLAADLRLSVAPLENSATRATPSGEESNPLDMLAAPGVVSLTAEGPLEAPVLNLRLECADLRMGDHRLEKAVASLVASPLNWRQALLLSEDGNISAAAPAGQDTAPVTGNDKNSRGKAATSLPGAAATANSSAPGSASDAGKNAAPATAKAGSPQDGQEAAPQLVLQLDVSGQWDNRPLSLAGQIFAGRNEDGILQAGLRKLRLDALGVEAAGQVAAVLPPGSMPGCDGRLDVRVTDWAALSGLVPGAQLDGDASLSLELRAERTTVPAASEATAATGATEGTAPEKSTPPKPAQGNSHPPAPGSNGASSAQADATQATAANASPAVRFNQQVLLRWNVPRLSYKAGTAAPLTLQNLSGEAALRDLFGAANLAARLDLAALRQGDLSLGTKVRANGSLNGPLDASVETSGSVAARVNARWQPGLVQLQRLEATLTGHDLGFKASPGASLRYGDSGMALSGLDMRLIPGGRLRVNAAFGQDKLDARLDLDALALTPWKKFVPALPEGTVEARARLTGSPARPGGDFQFSVRQLRIPGSPLKPLNLGLNGRIEGTNLVARLAVDKESVQALGGTEARLEARVPLVFSKDGLPQPDMHGPLRGQVRWKGAAGPLWSLLPLADQRFAGNVSMSVDLGGTLSAPSAKGSVLIDKGKYENLLQGVLLTNINLRLNLEEGRGKGASALPGVARLELDAAGGLGGKLRVAGYGSLDGSKLDIKTTIDHLRPLSRRDIRIELSGDVGVTGSATAPKVDGLITVNQGLVQLNKLAVGGSVTTLPISESPAPGTAQSVSTAGTASGKPEAKGSLNLRIVIPGRFLVEGHGLSSEWKADLLVSGTPEDPQITGQIMAVKGSFDFLTKIFKLSRGTITFAGGSLSNPLLDLKLANETPNLTSYVSITGTVRKMKLSLSSEPELPRDEILAQILFGKSTNELGRLENLRLAGAVAQLAGFGSGGGGIFDVTRNVLGVDVLRLSSTPSSGSGDPSGDEGMGAGTAVEMGKYITEIIYVGVQQGMKQGSTAFIIQLELTPRTSLELRSEQQSTWGGIRWKYNY